MKILHTSDWHLGRSLYGRKRYDEFSAFLDWLGSFIEAQAVDALLIAGDIFDTAAPNNMAQELYYRFLCRVAASSCRHIIIIAGNHDSPSFLNAPAELLKTMNIHVKTAITEEAEQEIIVLKDPSGTPEAIICAVPYLRDRDIRRTEPGESLDDKNQKLIQGIEAHYAEVLQSALKCREQTGPLPIIAMGHLFCAGSRTIDGDGVRELYVGSLSHVDKKIFAGGFDYAALGHLHVPQIVGNEGHIRYSGSPIPMGFGEAAQTKKIILVEFRGKTPEINEQAIPCFQKLERISGNTEQISQRILELKSAKSTAWLEIEYTDKSPASSLREILEAETAGTAMEILRIKNRQASEHILSRINESETLDKLNENEVFDRLLETSQIPHEDRPALIEAYQEIIQSMYEKDINAE